MNPLLLTFRVSIIHYSLLYWGNLKFQSLQVALKFEQEGWIFLAHTIKKPDRIDASGFVDCLGQFMDWRDTRSPAPPHSWNPKSH